jgi:hypothetical protein
VDVREEDEGFVAAEADPVVLLDCSPVELLHPGRAARPRPSRTERASRVSMVLPGAGEGSQVTPTTPRGRDPKG